MINGKVKQSVDARDVQQTRTNLLMITLTDRGFFSNEFDDSLDYAKQLDDLFDEFDNEPEKTEWNEDYWNYLYGSLMDNFCQERIDLLKKVGKKVYPSVAKTKSYQSISSSPRRTSIPRTQPGMSMPLKVGGALVIAAIGCATIGITKTAVAAAVILGGAFALQKKGMR